METITLSQEFFIENVTAADLYGAYIDPVQHAVVVSSDVEIDCEEGSDFSAWEGDINGVTVEVIEGETIVQKWRAENAHWPEGHYSKLILHFVDGKGGAKFIIHQENVPASDIKNVEAGWEDYYHEGFLELFA